MIKYATKGYVFAILPIVMGFTYSFAHGPFAYRLWPHLKIKAKKSELISRKRPEKLHRKQRVKKILRVYAHINPFHNLDVKSDQQK